MEIKNFWMVWIDGKSGPSIQHDNVMDAIREAGRLAQKQNLKAYVLEAVGVALPRVEVEFQEIRKCD
jgi:hypothetical protein